MTISEKVAYLKGLAEGLELDTEKSKEGKLISVIIGILEEVGLSIEDLEENTAALGEESVTLEDICEPYLMQIGFLTRTPRGRCATRLAYEHLGLKAPETGSPEYNGQQSLF